MPLTLADTVGHTSISGLSGDGQGAAQTTAYRVAFPSGGTVTTLYVYTDKGVSAVSSTVLVGLYSDSGTFLGGTTAITVTTTQWYNQTVSISIPSAGNYWFALMGDTWHTDYYVSSSNLARYNGNFMYPTFVNFDWNTGASWAGGTADIPIYADFTPEVNTVNVTLNSPSGNALVADLTQNFTFTPVLSGTDKFYNASLYVNNVFVASNTTALVNNVVNGINYTLPVNGVYNWTVQVWNSTHGIFPTANYTLLVYAPTPTPDPDTLTPDMAFAVALAIGVVFAVAIPPVYLMAIRRKDAN